MAKKFNITDNKTGKKFQIDWDGPNDPTENDINEMLSSQSNPSSKPQTVDTPEPQSRNILSGLKDMGAGIVNTFKRPDLAIQSINKTLTDAFGGYRDEQQEAQERVKPVADIAKRFGLGAAQVAGFNPDVISQDYKSGNYGALAGDTLPQAGMLALGAKKTLTRGIDPELLPKKPAIQILPDLPTPEPSISSMVAEDMKGPSLAELPTKRPGLPPYNTSQFGLDLAKPETNPLLSHVPNRLRPPSTNATVFDALLPDSLKVNARGAATPPTSSVELNPGLKTVNEPLPDIPNPVEGVKPKGNKPDVESIIQKNISDKAKQANIQNPGILDAVKNKVRNSSWYKAIYEPIGVSSLTKLERMGDSGKELSGLLKGERTESNRYGGEQAVSTRQAMRNLSPSEQTEVVKILDGQKSIDTASSSKVVDAYNSLRKSTNDLGDEAVKSGMVMKNSAGESIPFQKHEGEYFPHVYPDEMFKDPGDLTNRLIKTGKYSPEQAAQVAKSIIEKGERLDPSQHTRDFNLEGYKEDLPTLEKYQYDMARKITRTKRFGAKDTGDLNSPISKLIAKTSDPKAALDIVNDYLNRKDIGDKSAQYKIYNAVTKAEVASHLSQFAITNLGDFASFPREFGTKNTLGALKEVLTNPHGAVDEATKTGSQAILRKEILNDVGNGNLLGKAYGASTTEKFIRTMGSIAGKSTVQDLFAKAKANPKIYSSKLARFVDGDVSEILKQDSLTPKQIDFGGGRGVELTSGIPDKLTLSKGFFADNPLLRIPGLFKRFSFVTAKNINDAVASESTLPRKLAKATAILTAYQVAGEGVGDIKAAVKGLVSGKGVDKTIQDRGDYVGTGNPALDRIIANYLQSSLFGILGDTAESLSTRSNRNKATGFVGGPIGSDLDEVGNDFSAILNKSKEDKRNYQPLIQSAVKRVPYIGSGLAERLKPEPKNKLSPF